MAPDYLPRISSKNCGYPFTYIGGLYHGCLENLENVTAPCERWGCFAINYTGAVCAADIGKSPNNTCILTITGKHLADHGLPQHEQFRFAADGLNSISSFPQNGLVIAL